jgi:hypothetical protein
MGRDIPTFQPCMNVQARCGIPKPLRRHVLAIANGTSLSVLMAACTDGYQFALTNSSDPSEACIAVTQDGLKLLARISEYNPADFGVDYIDDSIMVAKLLISSRSSLTYCTPSPRILIQILNRLSTSQIQDSYPSRKLCSMCR